MDIINKAKDKIIDGVKAVDEKMPAYSLNTDTSKRIEENITKMNNESPVPIAKHELQFLDTNVLDQNLGKIAYTLDKAYMQNLESNYEALPFSSEVTYAHNIRAINIKKFVFNKNEQVIDCMKNVIGAFSNTTNTLAVVVHRSVKDVSIYFVCKNEGSGKDSESRDSLSLLNSSFMGNFPGSECEECKYKEKQSDKEDDTYLKDTFYFLQNPSVKNEKNNERIKAIALLSAIPSDKSDKYISQGLEKILNGLVPKEEKDEYSIIFLAEPLQQTEIRNIIDGFEEMATAISPFATHQFQNNISESESSGEMKSINESISHAVNKSHSVNTNISVSHSVETGASVSVPGASSSVSSTTTVQASAGYGYNWGKTDSTSSGTMKGTNHNIVVGSGKSTTLTYKSYLVSDLLQKIEAIIKRLVITQSTGLWRSAAYVLTNEKSVAINVAQSLNGLINGDESFIEASAIQSWTYEYNEGKETDFDRILKCINHFTHPVFENINDKKDCKDNDSLIHVNPTSNLTTSEFAKLIALPKQSLPGIPVIECAKFGRTVGKYTVKPLIKEDEEEEHSAVIKLGNICHMYSEENLPVHLNIKNLASHTFITGSTGSGKSFTIYQLLSLIKNLECKYKLKKDGKESEIKNKIHYLVIEPAKGEYKNEFGKNVDIVYSNNPNLSQTSLLRINPFSFYGETHILEHLDRLIEIFNVCWPMYAAMPAVLKDAVEKSYEDCGWNLTTSENKYDKNLFPSFADVTRNIRAIIDSSDYDAENKGAYKGSLVTRLRSLTSGLYGQIFTDDELSPEDLFEKNVIVDLSRVSASDTKSLIMGLLVLKLQEYRMNQGASELKHITVLEEAHNLLKRTSTEQTTESANLIGKSVEMLTNAIAEMRAFGEGFIIADQAPGLLDMAVIRNTNTKIILRLPDQSDRELVGRAANLNDEQITELARLPCGVAAVYQNDWIEPVLCKVEKFQNKGVFDNQISNKESTKRELTSEEKLEIAKFLFNNEFQLPKTLLSDLKKSRISARSRAIIDDIYIQKAKNKYDKEDSNNGIILAELYNDIADSLLKISKKTSNPDELLVAYNPMLANEIQDEDLRLKIFTSLIVNLFINELHNSKLLEDWTNKYKVR